MMASLPNSQLDGAIDDITQEPIPAERVITVACNQSTYTFDVKTLVKLLKTQPEFLNPFTRQPFDVSILQRVHDYASIPIHLRGCVSMCSQNLTEVSFKILRDTTLGDMLLNLLRQGIDRLTSMEELFHVDIVSTQNHETVYTYDLLTPLDELPQFHSLRFYGAMMSRREKTLPREMYPRWVDFARQTSRLDLFRHIPVIYWGPPPTQPLPKEEDSQALGKIIEASSSLHELATTMIQDLATMKISTQHAYAHIASLNQKFPNNRSSYIIEHLILSRVVDKFHLNPFRGVEGYYYADEYAPPNFNLHLSLIDVRSLLT
jgi:hypothetical protein